MSIDRMRLPPELSAKCVSSIRTKGDSGNDAWSAARKQRGSNVMSRPRESRCVGMEASGHARWFERLLGELNFELWIQGTPPRSLWKRERKQKTDRQDVQHILKLLRKDDFPKIWVPSWEKS